MTAHAHAHARHVNPTAGDDGDWDDFAMGDFESGEDDSA